VTEKVREHNAEVPDAVSAAGRFYGMPEEGHLPCDPAVFDPEGARAHLGLDVSCFARVVRCIWTEVSERRCRLDEALAAGELPRVVLHAHTIKSSAATIGAETLRQAAATVEDLAAKRQIEPLPAAVRHLRFAANALSNMLGIG